MQRYTTNKGTTLFYYVDYDKGGYNHFTDQTKARGYYLSVQRQERHFSAFTSIDNPAGACNMLLVEAGRRGKNKEAQAIEKAPEALERIAQRYGI